MIARTLHMRRLRRAAVAACLTAVVATIGTGASSAASPPWSALGPNLVPSHGALLGTWALQRSGRTTMQELSYVESEIGEPFAIYHTYQQATTPLPTPDMVTAAQSGHINLIDITPGDTWANVAAGADDSQLIAQAQGLKSFGYPVMVTWDHEADARIGQSGTPAQFVAAWRHVHDVYQAQGVTNVVWVWDLTGDRFNDVATTNAMYPGSSYVDWVADDGYNWYPGKSPSKWRSFQTVYQPFVDWAATYAPGKPLMSEEFGVQEDPADPNAKAQWYTDMLQTLKSWPQMKAVVYFNSSRIYPWWFDSTPQALAAFRQVAQDPYMNPETTPVAPAVLAAPSVTGTAAVGTTLTAQPGSWSSSPSFAYQWLACASGSCTPIQGATGTSYTPASADVDRSFAVTVTGSTTGGATAATSAPTGAVSDVSPITMSPLPLVKSATIGFSIYQPAKVTVQILGADGTVVRQRWAARSVPAGTYSMVWKRAIDAGGLAAAGSYSVLVSATDQAGVTSQTVLAFTAS